MYPLRDITIYHKNNTTWDRYNVKASYRGTSILNRNKSGLMTSDNALVRIFATETFEISKGDIVVNSNVTDNITGTSPLTTLSNIYGKDNVFTVKSIDNNTYEDVELSELNHTKIGLV